MDSVGFKKRYQYSICILPIPVTIRGRSAKVKYVGLKGGGVGFQKDFLGVPEGNSDGNPVPSRPE